MFKRMKKSLALLTVFAVILTAFAPAGLMSKAAASSDNGVTRVVTVDGDTNLAETSMMPYLKLKNDDGDWSDVGAGQNFRLTLSGDAEWNDFAATSGTATTIGAFSADVTDQAIAVVTTPGSFNVNNLKVEKINKKTIQVTFDGTAFAEDEYLYIPMNVDLNGSEGDVKVTIDQMDSAIDPGTYTFAVCKSGDTVITADEKEDIARASGVTGATITIDETIAGALDAGELQELKLKLPDGFEWNEHAMTSTTVGAVKLSSAFNSKVDTDVTAGAIGDGFVETGIDGLFTKVDDRDLYVAFQLKEATTSRGYLTITPVIDVQRDADYGDVTVSISGQKGDFSDGDVVIANYQNYDVTVSVDSVKDFVAGAYDDSDVAQTDDITISQNVDGSLIKGRVIDFELPEWAKISSLDDIDFDSNSPIKEEDCSLDDDNSTLEITVNQPTADNEDDIVFDLPLVINGTVADGTEIKATVSGAGIDKQEVVIGKVVAPVKVDVKMADVKIGVRNQAAPDITITETKAGALDEGDLWLTFKNAAGAFSFDNADIAVTSGDLELDEDASGTDTWGDASDDNSIKIVVDSSSTKPSTIKISGITMSVDRTAAEGKVQLDIQGDSVVQYWDYDGDKPATDLDADAFDAFDTRALRVDYANVVTPAPGEVATTAKFVIGSTTYTVVQNGVEVQNTLDVAPYIKDSRTFMPVRGVATALGVSEDNIVWNAATKTAVINKDGKLASITVGSNVVNVNGVNIVMDTKAEINNGRLMLPVRYLAMAFGVDVQWDATTQTATFTQ